MPGETFAEVFGRWRRQRRLSHSQLADILHLGSHSTSSHWERGAARPTVELLEPLAQVLGVPYQDMLEAWLSAHLPALTRVESRLLAHRAQALTMEDRKQLILLIDLWQHARDPVEALLATQLHQLLYYLTAHRQEQATLLPSAQ